MCKPRLSVKWTIDIAMDLAITGQRSSNTCPKVRAKWRPPVVGVSRLNVDASFMIASSEGASGLVLRNHDGALIRGQAILYNHVSNALVMETIAVRDGVQLASALGLPRVEVETDSSEVVKLWNGRHNGRLEVSSVLQEIEDLSGNMESFKLSFIRQEANEGAHLCSPQASSSRRRCFMDKLLQNDCKPDD